MNSRNRMHLVIATLALMLGSAVAYAHNGVEHVMGIVTTMTDSSITVDTVKHTTVTVLVDPATKFMKNNAPALPKDLKVGDRVAIDAKENSDKKLVGVTVKLGATTAVEHGAHKD
jgi:hypothetical protein